MIGLRHLMDPFGDNIGRLTGAGAKSGFTLGPVTVDPVGRRITRRGSTAIVEPRIMELLLYLSDRPGQTVSKQELIERVWRAHVVDEAVHRAISLLRSALGDSATNPAIIETVPRHGYRLLVRPTDARPPISLPVAAMIVLALASVGLFQMATSTQPAATTNPESIRPLAKAETTTPPAYDEPRQSRSAARVRPQADDRPARTASTETPVPTAIADPRIETPVAAPLPPTSRPFAIGSAEAPQPAPLAPVAAEQPPAAAKLR